MRKISLSSLALLALAGAANAADIPVRRPVYKAPPLLALYDWTGFYVGGHLGYAWTGKNWRTDTGFDVTSYTADGFIGGLQGGYNWQTGSWLLGAEVQVSFGRITTGRDWTDPNPDPVRPTKRTGTTVDHIGSAALRAGWVFDRSLIYAKGGLAWVHETYRLFDATTAGTPLLGSTSDTRFGWMLGIGFEYAFAGNWSAKIEYNYLDLGTERVTLAGVGGVPRGFDVRQDISLVKAGINYRFGPSAIIARY